MQWFHDFLNQNVQKEMESQIIKYLQMNLSLNLFRKQKLITHSPVLIISVITTARVTQWHMFSVPALFLVCFCKLDILSYQHDREMYWWWHTKYKYNIFLENKPLLSFTQKKLAVGSLANTKTTCQKPFVCVWRNLQENYFVILYRMCTHASRAYLPSHLSCSIHFFNGIY